MIFPTKFVCEDRNYSTYEKNVPAPLFRKSFNLNKRTHEAQLLICGLGFYELLCIKIYTGDEEITEERGSFECSNELVNKIYQMGRRSDVMCIQNGWRKTISGCHSCRSRLW